MDALKQVIEKAVEDHEYGDFLPDGFVNQYYDVLIQQGHEEPTFEYYLKKSKTKRSREVVLNTFYHHTLEFITELLDVSDEGDDVDEYQKEYLEGRFVYV